MTPEEIKAAAERLREPIYPATVSACDHIWNAHEQCQWCKWMRKDVDAAELSRAVLHRLAADEDKPGDPLSDLARIDDARFVPDDRGGHIWWNGMKWRPE